MQPEDASELITKVRQIVIAWRDADEHDDRQAMIDIAALIGVKTEGLFDFLSWHDKIEGLITFGREREDEMEQLRQDMIVAVGLVYLLAKNDSAQPDPLHWSLQCMAKHGLRKEIFDADPFLSRPDSDRIN